MRARIVQCTVVQYTSPRKVKSMRKRLDVAWHRVSCCVANATNAKFQSSIPVTLSDPVNPTAYASSSFTNQLRTPRINPQDSAMTGPRSILSTLALSALCVSNFPHAEATGRALRADCRDYQASEDVDSSVETLAPATETLAPTPAPTSFDGSLTLFSEADYTGTSYTIKMTEPNRCYKLDCYSDVALSVSWDSVISATPYTSVVLFAGDPCVASPFAYLSYSTSSGGTTSIPAVVGTISSVMIWTNYSDTSTDNGIVSTCPVGETAQSLATRQ